MLPAGDRSFAALLGDLVANIQELFRAEVKLARTELTEDIVRVKHAAALVAAAAILAVLALGFFLLGAMYGLAVVIPLWGAALVVGVAVLAAAAFCGMTAAERFKHVRGLPKTTRSLKENLTWSKEPGS